MPPLLMYYMHSQHLHIAAPNAEALDESMTTTFYLKHLHKFQRVIYSLWIPPDAYTV